MNIAIIPARGGSKRILNKNIKKFHGKPIIAWTIECAVKSNLFDKIIVSTDDKKIARVVKKIGAEVPFIRPTSLAKNSVGIKDVIFHSVSWLLKNNVKPKYICCMFPTAPLMKTMDVRLGYNKIKKNKYNYVFSSTTFPTSIFRSFYSDNKKTPKPCFPKKFTKTFRNKTNFFYDAGQFYWGKTEAWLNKKNIFAKYSSIIEIPRWRAVDINTLEDWNVANKLFMAIKNVK